MNSSERPRHLRVLLGEVVSASSRTGSQANTRLRPGEAGREAGGDTAEANIVRNQGSWDAQELYVVDTVSITTQGFDDSGVSMGAAVVGTWRRALVFGESWMRE